MIGNYIEYLGFFILMYLGLNNDLGNFDRIWKLYILD